MPWVYFSSLLQKELGVTWDVELYGELLKIGGGKERLVFCFLISLKNFAEPKVAINLGDGWED